MEGQAGDYHPQYSEKDEDLSFQNIDMGYCRTIYVDPILDYTTYRGHKMQRNINDYILYGDPSIDNRWEET